MPHRYIIAFNNASKIGIFSERKKIFSPPFGGVDSDSLNLVLVSLEVQILTQILIESFFLSFFS
jgi:hypothetical protein